MTRNDAGMQAVARVRAVREQDSQTGLQLALASERALRGRASELRQRLDGAADGVTSSGGAFVMGRAFLSALGEQLATTETRVGDAAAVSAAALDHWRRDKMRLDAVELLLERRAEEQREAERRHETQILDEAATQAWQRNRGGAA